MPRTFMIIFAATMLFGALTYVALCGLLDGGGAESAGLLVLFALPAAAGMAVLIRIAYLDGVAQRGHVARARELRQRL